MSPSAQINVAPLRSFQLEVIDQMEPGGCNLMLTRYGSGKSRMLLEVIRKGAPATCNLKAIVLCGRRNVRTWSHEIARWMPEVSVVTAEELPTWDLTLDAEKPTIMLVPHHRIRHDRGLLRQLRPAFVVMDESTVIKNPKAAITELSIEMAWTCWRHARKLAASGNPMPESPTNIWSQFQFCYGEERNPFGRSFYSFLSRWFLRVDHGYVLRHELQESFESIIDSWTARMTARGAREHAAMVGVKAQYTLELYDESPTQRRLIDQLEESWSLPGVGGTETEFIHRMTIQQKAMQIASGFYYVDPSDDGTGRQPAYLHECPKAERLMDIIEQLVREEPGRRIVVWRKYTASEEVIRRQWLAEPSIRDTVDFVFGAESELLEAFAAPKVDGAKALVIVVPISAARGLNDMVQADVDIWFDNEWSQELRDQGEARLDRIGQRKGVVTHVDLACPALADYDIAIALQAKNLTPERRATIVRDRKGVRQ